MKWYREYMISAPNDISGWFGIAKVPPMPILPEEMHGKVMPVVMWCYTGAQERADEIFEPIKRVGKPAFHGVHPMPYNVLNSAFDALFPEGTIAIGRGILSRISPMRPSSSI